MSGAVAGEPFETLDPDDWAEARALSHRIVDDAMAYLSDVRDRPVWSAMPPEVRAALKAPLPRTPSPLAEVYEEAARTVMAYPMGQRASALLVVVHGRGQLRRRAR